MPRFHVGAATANITPLLGCSQAGSMTDHIGTEIHDELHVRALVLDNGNARIALATIDSCAVATEVLDDAKKQIAAETKIPPSHVLLSATHTHSAPPGAFLFQSKPDAFYQRWMGMRIVDCLRMAAGRLQPAKIGWGIGSEPSLLFNRRYLMKPGTIPPDPFGRTTDQAMMNPPAASKNIIRPAGPIDPAVGLLAVHTLDGNPIALYGTYSLHYVGGVPRAHISADYFPLWGKHLLRLGGVTAPCMTAIANACSGNLNNVDVMNPPPKPPPPYRRMDEVAAILAAESYRVWRGIEFQEWVELSAVLDTLELGVRLPSGSDVATAQGILSQAGPGPYTDRSHIYALETIQLHNGYGPMVQVPMQALRIGRLGIATLPGEAFTELGLEVKKKSPFDTTFLVELANGYHGYIPTEEAFQVGGYETWRAKSSYLARDSAAKMGGRALQHLGKIAG
jgi:neutral ceramidase